MESVLTSINPFTNQIIETFECSTFEVIDNQIKNAHESFQKWRFMDMEHRTAFFQKLADAFEQNKLALANLFTLEMGKPIQESVSEIDKSIYSIRWYAENAQKLLTEECVDLGALNAKVTYQPLGVILLIMPWNFPLWQVIRAAIPAMILGNTVVLKHANTVTKSALAIQNIFFEAGFDSGMFEVIITDIDKIPSIIDHKLIKGVSLTGSEEAGIKVAEKAGSGLKPVILELGGSDPFIVCQDADLELASTIAVKSRFINGGQSCIAAKRFLIQEQIYHQFLTLLTNKVKKLIVGDPSLSITDIGPLCKPTSIQTLDSQIDLSIRLGARKVYESKSLVSDGNFFSTTIVDGVLPGMPLFDEEVFGPVISLTTFSNPQEALKLANQTDFGLAASIFTRDEDLKKYFSERIEVGSVFINEMVKSDVRIPFGGIKKSGFGRELGKYGLLSFVNIKTIVT